MGANNNLFSFNLYLFKHMAAIKFFLLQPVNHARIHRLSKYGLYSRTRAGTCFLFAKFGWQRLVYSYAYAKILASFIDFACTKNKPYPPQEIIKYKPSFGICFLLIWVRCLSWYQHYLRTFHGVTQHIHHIALYLKLQVLLQILWVASGQ